MNRQLTVAPKNLTLKECGLTRAQVKAVEFSARYKEMIKAMKRVDSIDECRTISAESVAMAAYFKQLNDREPMALALSIKARAYRRIGELLNRGARADAVSTVVGRLATSIARIPEAEFEAALAQRPIPGIGTLSQRQLRQERGEAPPAPRPPPDATELRAERLRDLRRVIYTLKQLTNVDVSAICAYHESALRKVPLTNTEKTCVLGLAEDLIAGGEYLISVCKR